MPPATLASMARLIPARMARSQISEPQAAISSLLAVTMDFLLAMAPSIISAATPVPPTSSATISTSGRETTWRQSVVGYTRPSDSGSFLPSTDRLQTAVTCSGKPSLSAICAAFSASTASVPDPTLPKPITPTFTGCILDIITTGFARLERNVCWVQASYRKVQSDEKMFDYLCGLGSVDARGIVDALPGAAPA